MSVPSRRRKVWSWGGLAYACVGMISYIRYATVDFWTGFAISQVAGLLAGVAAFFLADRVLGPYAAATPPTVGDDATRESLRPGLLSLSVGLMCGIGAYVFLGPQSGYETYLLAGAAIVIVMIAVYAIGQGLNTRRL